MRSETPMPSHLITSFLYLLIVPYLIITIPLCLFAIARGFSSGPAKGIEGILFSLGILAIPIAAWYLGRWISKRAAIPSVKPNRLSGELDQAAADLDALANSIGETESTIGQTVKPTQLSDEPCLAVDELSEV